MTIDNDIFPELNHELIKPLQGIDDIDLWKLWQKNKYQGRYLIVLFSRYFNVTQSIDNGLNKAQIKTDYFQRLWFFIIDRLLIYKISDDINLSDFIVQLTEEFFNEEKQIINELYDNYDNQLRYFPLKYYLLKSLDKLSPIERIILLMKDKFVWSEEKILEYLQQKENITLPEVKAHYIQAHSRLLNYLPTDIISIYLQND